MSIVGPSKVGCIPRSGIDLENVERLLRAQTNLLLDNSLNTFVATSLPWEVDMIIDEPKQAEVVKESALPSAIGASELAVIPRRK